MLNFKTIKASIFYLYRRMNEPTLTFKSEFELTPDDKTQINRLLSAVFTDTNYRGQAYFKQLCHHRLLLWQGAQLIGHLGIDYRVMNLNGQEVTVWGVAGLAVDPALQGKGLGTQLMQEFERIATAHKHNIDFLFLVTDVPAFYERLGFTKTTLTIQWLKIYQGKNYGLANEQITDCDLMFKKVGDKDWSDGVLDMLGYMY